MKNIFQTKYIAIGAIIIVLLIIIFAGGHKGTTGNQSAQPNSQSATTPTSQTQTTNSSLVKTSGQTYYNNLLGFSFDNPRPGSWIMSTNNPDHSLVYFGPKVLQVGVGVKVTYNAYADEFPTYEGKITTVNDLKNAVTEKYSGAIPQSISIIYAGGFYIVEVKGLTVAFNTTNVYFVFLSTGTLNFGGTGNLSAYIHKI